jgi:putative membrane protein
MRNLVLRIIINAIAIAIVAALVPGIQLLNDSFGTLLIIGAVFGIINALLKPILTILTCPLVILTLGLFTLVINAILLLITANFLPERIAIDGFWPALLGGIIMSIVSMVLEGVFGLKDDDDKKKRDRD